MAQVACAASFAAKGPKEIPLPEGFFSADRAEDFFVHPFSDLRKSRHQKKWWRA